MLGNDQFDAFAKRLLRRIAKQRGGGAVPANDGSGLVGTDDSVSDLIENRLNQSGPVVHGYAPFGSLVRPRFIRVRTASACRLATRRDTGSHISPQTSRSIVSESNRTDPPRGKGIAPPGGIY